MGLIGLFRKRFRIIFRLCLQVLLISLPVTFFPIAAGIKAAIEFHFWNHAQVSESMAALTRETESKQFLDYYNVPGAPTIHEFQAQQGPFHVPELGSFDWSKKLGFTRPLEHENADVGVDKWVNLDGLVRDESSQKQRYMPKSYWVYVTMMPRWIHSEWDEAFDEVLQRSYVRPLAAGSGAAYVDCISARFLCSVWGVKVPTLLHFSVGDTSLQQQDRDAEERLKESDGGWDSLEGWVVQDFTYIPRREHLFPVTVRIIELPLEDAKGLLPRSILATPAKQMEALLLDPDPLALVDHWDPWDIVVQTMRRFNDLSNSMDERVGSWKYYLAEWDKWYSYTVLNPIFGAEFTGNHGFLAEVQGTVFTIGFVLAQIAHFPFTVVWRIYAWYAGLAWDGQPSENIVPKDVPSEGDNWMSDLMAVAFDGFLKNISAEMSEQAGRAAVTPAA